MKSQKCNFTKKWLEALPLPSKDDGQAVYYDAGCTDGLCLIVTYGGAKTFYFYMKFQGMPKRVKIGRFGHVELSEARKIAHTLREIAGRGEDPGLERQDSLKDMTLRQYYESVYVPQYAAIQKKSKTRKNDDSIFKNSLSEFHNRKMKSITNDDIRRHHANLMKKISPYVANRMLSLIRHMYNKAYELGYPKRLENPAIGIKSFKEVSRDRFMNSEELQRFFIALKDSNQVFKEYVMLSLFLGQRRQNILGLRWCDVDFANGLIHFSDTKNGEPINVPITTHAMELLKDMHQRATSVWLFPSNISASGHFEEPKSSWRSLLNRADIKDLRLHDLRRTLGSYQAINGTSLHIIGKSLGHKSANTTQIYARLTNDPVLDSMQKATDRMLGLN